MFWPLLLLLRLYTCCCACSLLPQDMASWVRDGIGGLQSVVLYSLPELDGAIDTGGQPEAACTCLLPPAACLPAARGPIARAMSMSESWSLPLVRCPPAVPLGGLVGDNIYLVPERVKRLANRIHIWVALRRTPPQVNDCARNDCLGGHGSSVWSIAQFEHRSC